MADYFQSFLQIDEEEIAPSTQQNREFLNIVHFLQFLIRRDYKPSELYSAYTDFVRLGTYIQPLEVRETLDDRLFPSLTQERREKRNHLEMSVNEKKSEVVNKRFEMMNEKKHGNEIIKENENGNENKYETVEETENETVDETVDETDIGTDEELIHLIPDNTIKTVNKQRIKSEIPNDSSSTINSNMKKTISHPLSFFTHKLVFSPHSVLDSLVYQPIETVFPTQIDNNQITSLLSFVCREGDFLSISSFVLNRFLFST